MTWQWPGSMGHMALANVPTPSTPTTDLVRLPVVVRRTSLKKSAIYAQMARGEFPRAVHLTSRSVAWYSHEVDAWIASRPRAQALTNTNAPAGTGALTAHVDA